LRHYLVIYAIWTQTLANSLEQALYNTEMILMLTMRDRFSRSIYNLVVLIPHLIEEFTYVVKRHIRALM